jgi:hypothetical protein
MNAQMDERFAAALRSALVEHVEAAQKRSRFRRGRWRFTLAGVVAVAVGGSGVAFATGALPLPGGDVVADLAGSVAVTESGTKTVELGTPPPGATHLDIQLTCLTAGTFTVADGAEMECSAADAASGKGTMFYQLSLRPRSHSTTISAAQGARWRLIATYSSVSTTAWGVNDRGLTYGIANDHGTPDLVAVYATNGRQGYVYAAQLSSVEPMPTSPDQAVAENDQSERRLPVYESDGVTRIGTFVINSRPTTR